VKIGTWYASTGTESESGVVLSTLTFSFKKNYVMAPSSCTSHDYVDMSYEQIRQEILNKVGEVKK